MPMETFNVEELYEKEFSNNIRNSRYLQPLKELDPKIVYERKQGKKILKTIFQFSKRGHAPTLLISGKTATGKTSLTNYYTDEALDYLKNEQDVHFEKQYVDCTHYNSPNKALFRLLKPEGEFDNQSLTVKMDQYKDILQKRVDNGVKTIIIIDDVDKARDIDQLIHFFLRAVPKDSLLLCLITKEPHKFHNSLNGDTKSSLIYERINFKQYKPKEIYNILRKRCEVSFHDYDLSLLKLASAIVKKRYDADIRIGIRSLSYLFGEPPFDYTSKELNHQMAKAKSDTQIGKINSCTDEQVWILKQVLDEEMKHKDLVKRYQEQVQDLSRQSFIRKSNPLYEKNLLYGRNERVGRKYIKFVKSLLNEEAKEFVESLPNEYKPI